MCSAIKNCYVLTRKLYNCLCLKSRNNSSNNIFHFEAVDLSCKEYGAANDMGSIMILHGILGRKTEWLPIGAALAKRTRKHVYVVDMRNHGDSPHHPCNTYMDMVADLYWFIMNRNIHNPCLIGHDVSGRAAMLLSLLEPNMVDKLVAVDISPLSFTEPFAILPRLVDTMATVNFDPKETDLKAAKEQAKDKLKSSLLVDNVDSLNLLLNNVDHRWDNTIGWVCNLYNIQNALPMLSTFPEHLVACNMFPGETLFIAGENSNYLEPGDFTKTRLYFPCFHVKYLSEAGHNVHSEKPEEFIEAVSAFASPVII